MFAAERKKIIKRYLIENQKVSVAKLSDLLEVSEVTIRRDLELLEKSGFLQRTHGGAILAEEPIASSSISLHKDPEILEQQEEIASTAINLVSDYDILMLTDGQTNLQIAKKLTSKTGLTVLTNDILIALEFSSSPTNKLIMLGGDLYNNAVYGQLSQNNLNNFSLKHVFIDVDGISLNNGISVNGISKASLIQQACNNASIITAVCLPDDFGKDSLYRVGPITYPNRIITSSSLLDEYKKELFEKNIQLYTSIDLYEG